MEETEFTFKRQRGIAWVCDIANSSRYLNDNKTAELIEEFLPRFHWTARVMVESAGGIFVKWTGDGFLAWFPAVLHRDLAQPARIVLNAAWHMSFLVNVTRLDVGVKEVFRIRHGVAIEHDALVTAMTSGSAQSVDLVGRGIVLAFRLAGVTAAKFPTIATSGEVLEVAGDFDTVNFSRWRLTSQDRLKHFKGERWGTKSLYVSIDKRTSRKSSSRLVRSSKELLHQLKNPAGTELPQDRAFLASFINRMIDGPLWGRKVVCDHHKFIMENLALPLEKAIGETEKLEAQLKTLRRAKRQ